MVAGENFGGKFGEANVIHQYFTQQIHLIS